MPNKDGHILIGEIVGFHGLKGVLKIRSYAESLSVFEPESSVFLETDGEKKVFTVEWVKAHKRGALMALETIRSRNQAETLMGAGLFIEKTRLPDLEDGVWYWSDLMGLSVYTINEEYLGRITDIITTGSNDVYVVKDGKNETLVPALEWVVTAVDMEKGVMQVVLPEIL